MKNTQEFDGKNIEEAIDNACSSLNIAKKNLVYDVISSGSTGIFGIVGVKKARIRVTLPKSYVQNVQKNNQAVDTSEMDGIMSIVDEAFGQKPEKSKETEPNPLPRKEPKAEAPEPEKTEARKPSPRKHAPRKTWKKKHQPATAATAAPEEIEEIEEIEEEITVEAAEDVASIDNDDLDRYDDSDEDDGFPPKYKDEIPVDVADESIALGKETLQKMVDLITTDAVVVAQADQDRLLLRVEGGNSGVLIGRRGQTLEAMQFLTDKIVNRKSTSRVRLKIDIEGYMETRKANLISLAHKMADKAKKTGKPATINQMTAQDRRTVHLALKDDTGVRTQSMGDGYYRRLVIFPKKGAFKKRRNTRK